MLIATLKARRHHIMGSNRALGLFSKYFDQGLRQVGSLVSSSDSPHRAIFGGSKDFRLQTWRLKLGHCAGRRHGDQFGALHSALPYVVWPQTSRWHFMGNYA
jgi:hypothetical protein